MPYIADTDRSMLDPSIDFLIESLRARGETFADRAGALNYVITRLTMGALPEDFRYADLALAAGVFHGAAAEFDRRVVAGYENVKWAENGDVYPRRTK